MLIFSTLVASSSHLRLERVLRALVRARQCPAGSALPAVLEVGRRAAGRQGCTSGPGGEAVMLSTRNALPLYLLVPWKNCQVSERYQRGMGNSQLLRAVITFAEVLFLRDPKQPVWP